MIRDRLVRWYRVRDGYWFVPKFFGYGATPATWQGWLAVAIFTGLLLIAVKSVHGALPKIAVVVALTLPFMLLVHVKTDGAWRFRWGGGEK